MTRWEITEYDDIIRAIATRRKSLSMSQEMVNYKTGLADNYINKIECRMRRLGNLSLPCILEVLGVELVLEPIDDEPPPSMTTPCGPSLPPTNAALLEHAL